MNLRSKLFNLITIGVFLIGQWGCATRPQLTPPEFPPNLRSQLGTIGVASNSSAKQLLWQTPTEGWTAGLGQGAAKGVKNTAGNGLMFAIASVPYGLFIPGLIALALGLALAPPAALIGGVYGAIAAESPENIEKAETQLQKAWENQNLPLGIETAMISVAQERAHQTMIPLNCQASQKPREQNECGDLPMEWVDSVLNLKMTNVVLKGDSGVNPPLRLSLVLQAEVIRKAGRVVLDNQIFDYSGGDHTFLGWAANDAKLLKEEFMVGYETLAQQVVDYLFLPAPSPSPSPDAVDDDLAW